MKPEPTEPDYAALDPEALAELGIFTPLARRYDARQNPYWIIPNQKIVAVDPKLPGLQNFIERQQKADGLPREKSSFSGGEVITRPPALENSLENFFRSLFDLLAAWFRWLFGRRKSDSKRPVVGDNGTFRWFFEGASDKKIDFTIVRASECPNEEAEFGKPSVSVLLEWKQGAGQGDLAEFEELRGQADNHFISNPQPPSGGPTPPVEADAKLVHVYPSDFEDFDNDDKAYYSNVAALSENEPIVAVMDTGVKFKWLWEGNVEREHTFVDAASQQEIIVKFKLAKAPADACMPEANFGYCSIGDYRRNPDSFSQLAALGLLTNAQIMRSPYDDHRVDEQVEGEPQPRTKVGRHGTFIAGILNANGCRVLPVKAFNCAARGTLFDVLDGLNYLIARKQAGMPIKVLNASFSGKLDEAGLKLFYKKMKTLTDLGVWVVASAGNEGISLDGTDIYPAQFGLSGHPYSLEKVITVNSYYDNAIQGNTGAAVSITARSPEPGGFPSPVPVRDNPHVLRGTSFAAPYVACALARLDPVGPFKPQVVNQILSQSVGGVDFTT